MRPALGATCGIGGDGEAPGRAKISANRQRNRAIDMPPRCDFIFQSRHRLTGLGAAAAILDIGTLLAGSDHGVQAC